MIYEKYRIYCKADKAVLTCFFIWYNIVIKEGGKIVITFKYDESDLLAQYYEILMELMIHWENEIVEFKEAKGQYDTNKIGQYFSAISNEANLKRQQYGWLIFGISENHNKK